MRTPPCSPVGVQESQGSADIDCLLRLRQWPCEQFPCQDAPNQDPSRQNKLFIAYFDRSHRVTPHRQGQLALPFSRVPQIDPGSWPWYTGSISESPLSFLRGPPSGRGVGLPCLACAPREAGRGPSYTQSPLQDSRLLGPRPGKILATTYEQMGS